MLDVVSGAYLEQLIEGVCTLLKSNAREVLRSALAFIKVLTLILDQADLAQYVEQLVSGCPCILWQHVPPVVLSSYLLI